MSAIHPIELHKLEQQLHAAVRLERVALAEMAETVRQEAAAFVSKLRNHPLPGLPDVDSPLEGGDLEGWEGAMASLDRLAGEVADELELIETGLPGLVVRMVDDQYSGLDARTALTERTARLRTVAAWLIRMSERVEDHIDMLVATNALAGDQDGSVSLEDLRRQLGR